MEQVLVGALAGAAYAFVWFFAMRLFAEPILFPFIERLPLAQSLYVFNENSAKENFMEFEYNAYKALRKKNKD